MGGLRWGHFVVCIGVKSSTSSRVKVKVLYTFGNSFIKTGHMSYRRRTYVLDYIIIIDNKYKDLRIIIYWIIFRLQTSEILYFVNCMNF